MPSFFEITTGHWTVKALFASVVLVMVGGGITIVQQLRGPSIENPDVILKDSKEGSDFVQTYSADEFRQLRDEHDREYMAKLEQENPQAAEQLKKFKENEGMMMAPMMMTDMNLPNWGNPGWPMKNPNTGEYTLFRAIKCRECGEIYFRGQAGDARLADKCPKCGYSYRDEQRKKQREEEKKTRQK